MPVLHARQPVADKVEPFEGPNAEIQPQELNYILHDNELCTIWARRRVFANPQWALVQDMLARFHSGATPALLVTFQVETLTEHTAWHMSRDKPHDMREEMSVRS
jgi:hypothetical protein